MEVQPSPQVREKAVSPEFEVDAKDGKVIVEVHSRHLDKDQLDRTEQYYAGILARQAEAVAKAEAAGKKGYVSTSGIIGIFPTGEPEADKAGDSLLCNTISRIAAVKESEHQVDQSKPFVLWLDLQDVDVWGPDISPEMTLMPLYSEREGVVGGGAFWFALYGRKEGPLLESRGYQYRSTLMQHEGRFRQTMKSHGGPTRVSAVVFSLPRATVLMEHPCAIHPLPPRFRAAMLKAPRFRLDLSLIEWQPGLVGEIIEVQHHLVNAAVKALEAFDTIGSK
jgi:hypothetical protein